MVPLALGHLRTVLQQIAREPQAPKASAAVCCQAENVQNSAPGCRSTGAPFLEAFLDDAKTRGGGKKGPGVGVGLRSCAFQKSAFLLID